MTFLASVPPGWTLRDLVVRDMKEYLLTTGSLFGDRTQQSQTAGWAVLCAQLQSIHLLYLFFQSVFLVYVSPICMGSL